jgi:hypothetical protein
MFWAQPEKLNLKGNSPSKSIKGTVPFNQRRKIMKKLVLAVLVLSLWVPALALAEKDQKEKMPGMSERPMGMPMFGMGAKMAKAQMVATDEGGEIVLAGNKLMKYDADLNLVKEVELKVEMPGMGMMGGKQCPMMGQGSAAAAAESQGKKA